MSVWLLALAAALAAERSEALSVDTWYQFNQMSPTPPPGSVSDNGPNGRAIALVSGATLVPGGEPTFLKLINKEVTSPIANAADQGFGLWLEFNASTASFGTAGFTRILDIGGGYLQLSFRRDTVNQNMLAIQLGGSALTTNSPFPPEQEISTGGMSKLYVWGKIAERVGFELDGRAHNVAAKSSPTAFPSPQWKIGGSGLNAFFDTAGFLTFTAPEDPASNSVLNALKTGMGSVPPSPKGPTPTSTRATTTITVKPSPAPSPLPTPGTQAPTPAPTATPRPKPTPSPTPPPSPAPTPTTKSPTPQPTTTLRPTPTMAPRPSPAPPATPLPTPATTRLASAMSSTTTPTATAATPQTFVTAPATTTTKVPPTTGENGPAIGGSSSLVAIQTTFEQGEATPPALTTDSSSGGESSAGTDEDRSKGPDSDALGMGVGIGVAVLCVIALLSLVAALVLRRRRRQQRQMQPLPSASDTSSGGRAAEYQVTEMAARGSSGVYAGGGGARALQMGTRRILDDSTLA